MVGATPAGEGDDEQQQQQQTKQGGGRKFVGMMVALVLIIGVISTKSLRATEQISEFLDTESEESKIGVDEVFVSPSPQTPPSPPLRPTQGRISPARNRPQIHLQHRWRSLLRETTRTPYRKIALNWKLGRCQSRHCLTETLT